MSATTYQLQKLDEARLSEKAMIVYKYVLANPGQTRLEIAQGTGLTEKCVCGRFGDMQPTGIMYDEPQGKGPKVVFATIDPLDIKENIRIYESDRDKKVFSDLKKNLKWLKGRGKIDHSDLTLLYPIVRRTEQNVK